MRGLEKLVLDKAAEHPGPPPKIEWLALAKLVIDDQYQRGIETRGLANIKKIAAEFKWSRFSPVMVTAVARGNYAIIDGQHRCTAALSLGYERVPCCIVYTEPGEAAAIFAAINGNVTSLSVLQVFRAARAAGELWAQQIDDVCRSAGVTALTHPIQQSKQKPFQTMAIAALRESNKRFGLDVTRLALRALVSTVEGAQGGLLNSLRIRKVAFLIAQHPGWLGDPQGVIDGFAQHNLFLTDLMNVEASVVRRMGDGRSAGLGWTHTLAKVRDYQERRFSSSQIATVMRLPHAQVMRALVEIKADIGIAISLESERAAS
jgi:hypothetical protein